MINGFFKVVQDDVALIGSAFTNNLPKTAENEQKVTRAAIRVFAAFAMVSSAILGLSALSTGAGVFRFVQLGLSFALSHDLFVIFMNVDRPAPSTLFSAAKGFAFDVQDLWNGTKTGNSAPRHPYTEETFLRRIWDALLAKG